MDKAIKKASIVIQRHSIKVKNREYCKWIDDSYLLIGKAYFYKGEFLEAKKTFDFIKNNFKKTEIADESKLWLARCYINMKDYSSSENILDELQSKRRFPEKLEKDLHLVFADLYLKQDLYSEAADELKLSTNLIKRKSNRARIYYIIGQIYQDANNFVQSKKYFELALKANPDYEMVFNAKMNLAKSLRSKKDLKTMRENLKKMIKDEKNKEYLDQIYFTLAEMDLVEEDTLSAIENYNSSTKYSVQNDIQKSLSFLELGKIYYIKKNYHKAKTFYDSTYIFMPENHISYHEVQERQKTLENLIHHLNTISLEDSLQFLAGLSESERKSIIQSVISEVIKKEREELMEQQNRARLGMEGRNARNENFGQNVSGGKWYFYNPATLSFGMSEFRKIWGKRKLEDDWRRSNKKSLSMIEEDSLSKKNDQKNNDLKSERYYLDQIPLNKEDIEASNNKIINAYYQASVIYKNDLNEIEMSNNMLDRLIKRFPSNEDLTPYCYYLLYLSQKETNEEKANQTKLDLIKHFPESNYAKSLNNENYISFVLSQKNQRDSIYNNIYLKYKQGEYSEVVLLTKEEIKNQDISDEKRGKYYLINILSSFKQDKDTLLFVKNIEDGIQKYSTTQIAERLKEILNLIKNPDLIERRNEIAILKSPYIYKEYEKHYVIIITPKKNTDANYIKTLISDFNAKNFSNEVIEINSMMLGLDRHLIIIKTFQNKLKSFNYQNNLFLNKEFLNEINKTKFKKFIISEENFIEFYKRKDVDGYTDFYNNKYK